MKYILTKESIQWIIDKIKNHINNSTNPHAVTKIQVGLGNVQNIDQSKAIKSITRNGTTFTATALDGSKTNFDQQDTNTTYKNATTSISGLMSATDKVKLDSIDAKPVLTFVNKTLNLADAVKDSTYSDYPYHIDMVLSGCKSNYVPDIYLATPTGVISNVCQSFDGYVRFYSMTNSGKITIPTIKLTRGV